MRTLLLEVGLTLDLRLHLPSADGYRARCPFCGHGRRPFTVRQRSDDDPGEYACRECGIKGTLLELAAQRVPRLRPGRGPGRPAEDPSDSERRARSILRDAWGLPEKIQDSLQIDYDWKHRCLRYPSDPSDPASARRKLWLPRPPDEQPRFDTGRRKEGRRANNRRDLPVVYPVRTLTESENGFWIVWDEASQWILSARGVDAIAPFGDSEPLPIEAWAGARVHRQEVHALLSPALGSTQRSAVLSVCAGVRAFGCHVIVHQPEDLRSADDLAAVALECGDDDTFAAWLYETPSCNFDDLDASRRSTPPSLPGSSPRAEVAPGVSLVRDAATGAVQLAITVERDVEHPNGSARRRPVVVLSDRKWHVVPPGPAGTVRELCPDLCVRDEFEGGFSHRWSGDGQRAFLDGTARVFAAVDLCDAIQARFPAEDAVVARQIARFVVSSYVHPAWPDAPVLQVLGAPTAVDATLQLIEDAALNPVRVPWDAAGDWARRVRRWRGVANCESPPRGRAHHALDAKRGLVRLTRGDGAAPTPRAGARFGGSAYVPQVPVVLMDESALLTDVHGPLMRVSLRAGPQPFSESQASDFRDALYCWALRAIPHGREDEVRPVSDAGIAEAQVRAARIGLDAREEQDAFDACVRDHLAGAKQGWIRLDTLATAFVGASGEGLPRASHTQRIAQLIRTSRLWVPGGVRRVRHEGSPTRFYLFRALTMPSTTRWPDPAVGTRSTGSSSELRPTPISTPDVRNPEERLP